MRIYPFARAAVFLIRASAWAWLCFFCAGSSFLSFFLFFF
jgi:hypothetical protein